MKNTDKMKVAINSILKYLDNLHQEQDIEVSETYARYEKFAYVGKDIYRIEVYNIENGWKYLLYLNGDLIEENTSTLETYQEVIEYLIDKIPR